jgi:hypothetical protein
MAFVKAKRDYVWFKGLQIASSGGGKSYGSLKLASGFAKELSKQTGKEERIAFINTEPNRGTIYANEFDYDIMDLTAPYTPEKYINAIDDAVKAGYKILVIDSITHEWSGKGGCLEIHSKIPGNSYTAWRTVTPRHEAFMDKILDSNIHIFATVRGDDKYILEEVNGKQQPKKVPLGYDQRKNTEYLFITTFVLDLETHLATTAKDNTHIFENQVTLLDEKHGIELCKWALGEGKNQIENIIKERQQIKDDIKANEESEIKDVSKKSTQEVKDIEKSELSHIESLSLEELKTELLSIATEKAKNYRQDVIGVLIDYKGNPNNITTLEDAKKIYVELNKVGGNG